MNVKITEQDGEYTATFLVNKNEVGKFKWNTKNSYLKSKLIYYNFII